MLFGFEHAGIVPDIVCLGKTLTAGYLTLSATVTTREIGDQISSGPEGCFMHGQTYMANPLACAVASENLSILMEGKWKSQVRQIEVQLKKELVPLLEHPIVADVKNSRGYRCCRGYKTCERRSLTRAIYQRQVRGLDLSVT
ncbi:CCT_1a_G0025980.mRNA.1.CDS.1 [Saccharomyces cerevisiae]|nr:CCT_1a_G0025980.mRNA.1.CDS.1 [Saccharomyces cerevisiae]CAI7347916.1 CCT_1a_G0025980.mRNA.1.CDS.1 [Saccharomyces cerevisiae]